MKKIKQNDFDRLREYAGHLDDIRNELEDIIAKAQQQVEEALSRANDYIDEANGFVGDLASEAETYYDERSDNWRDGDAGSTYCDWLSEIQNCANELNSINFELDGSEVYNDLETMCATLNDVRQSPEE